MGGSRQSGSSGQSVEVSVVLKLHRWNRDSWTHCRGLFTTLGTAWKDPDSQEYMYIYREYNVHSHVLDPEDSHD